MKNIQVVLAPLFPRDSRRLTERFLQNTLLFCAWSGARLRVLAGGDPEDFSRLLAELRTCGDCESVECSVERQPPREVLHIVRELGDSGAPEMLALSLEKGMLRKPIMSREKATVFLEANLPTLVLPSSLLFHYPPVSSLLVAMSGERRQSEALRTAITLGSGSGIPVDLLHVTDTAKEEQDASVLGEIADEFQHEYPRMVEEFITEASPFSSDKEKLCIRHFWHLRGDVSQHIRHRMGGDSGRMLVMEWKGNLRTGRAEVLRSVLRHADFPVLLVRPEVQGHARLRIGKDFPLAG